MTNYKGDVDGDVLLRPGDGSSELTKVSGSLYIDAKDAHLPALVSVDGGLYIYAEGAQLPALTSVEGYLSIRAEGAQLPALTNVGGSLLIDADGAQLLVLTRVAGSLTIIAHGVRLPALTSVAERPFILTKLPRLSKSTDIRAKASRRAMLPLYDLAARHATAKGQSNGATLRGELSSKAIEQLLMVLPIMCSITAFVMIVAAYLEYRRVVDFAFTGAIALLLTEGSIVVAMFAIGLQRRLLAYWLATDI